MKLYETILIDSKADTLNIILNRPYKGNAINLTMVREVTEVIHHAEENRAIRFIIFSANGKSFCSGADLQWMADSIYLSKEKNKTECIELAFMYYSVYNSTKIVISLIHGACIGGGIGFTAAADYAIATSSSFYSFSEVKLGLVPAIISPYVIFRLGNLNAKQLMLTGERINTQKALTNRLIDEVVEDEELEVVKNKLIESLRAGDQNAQLAIKALNNKKIERKQIEYLAELLADLRITDTFQKTVSEFLTGKV